MLENAPRSGASIAWTDHPPDSEHPDWLNDAVSHISASALAAQPSAEEMIDAMPPLTAQALANVGNGQVRVQSATELLDVATPTDSYVILQRMTPPPEKNRR